MKRQSLTHALIVLAAVAASVSASADDFIWNGGCDQYWETCCIVNEDPCLKTNNWSAINTECPGCPPLPGPNDSATVLAGTCVIPLGQGATLQTFQTLPPLLLAGGGLTVHVGATYDNGIDWSAGSLSGAGLHLTHGAHLTSNEDKWIIKTTVENTGPFIWRDGGDIILYSYEVLAHFTNTAGALFEILNDQKIGRIHHEHGGGGTITNAGLVLKRESFGVTSFLRRFDNEPSGVVQVETGTLYLGRDTTNWGNLHVEPDAVIEIDADFDVMPGSSMTGAGLFRHVSGIIELHDANVAVEHLESDFLRLDGNGTLSILGTHLAIDPVLADSTTTRIEPDGMMVASGLTVQMAHVCSLENHGHFVWESGEFLVGDVSILNAESGLFEILHDDRMLYTEQAPNGMTIINEGHVLKSAGDGLNQLHSRVNLLNRGLVEVQTGGLELTGENSYIQEPGGRLELHDATISLSHPLVVDAGEIAGSGTFDNTLDLNGQVVLEVRMHGHRPQDIDHIHVTGLLDLGGRLRVVVDEGVTPRIGVPYEILSCPNIQSVFHKGVEWSGLPVGMYGTTTIESDRVFIEFHETLSPKRHLPVGR